MPTINGTAAADTLSGGTGEDTIHGLGGDDVLDGLDGNDILNGGAGSDILFGFTGADTLNGDDGDDVLEGGTGNDILNGGLGFDFATFLTSATGVTVNLTILTSQNTGQGLDTLSGVEGLLGSAFNDILTGNDQANYIYGEGGIDRLYGGGGDDILETIGSDGLSGAVFDGGSGYDILMISNGGMLQSSTVTGIEELVSTGIDLTGVQISQFQSITAQIVRLADATTVDLRGRDMNVNEFRMHAAGGTLNLQGSLHHHMITGAGGADTVTGGLQNDYILGAGGADRLDGDAGDDVLEGGDGNDVLIGGAGMDGIDGGAGADVIEGGADNDTLNGHQGDDVINGGDGDDILSGGDGVDILDGGLGNDYFQMSFTAGQIDTYRGGAGDDRFVYTGTTPAFGMAQVEGGDGFDSLELGASDLVYDLAAVNLSSIERVQASAARMTVGQLNALTAVDVTRIEIANAGVVDLRGKAGLPSWIVLSNAGNTVDVSGSQSASSGYFTIDGGTGADIIRGGTETNFLNGGGGADQLFGGGQDDRLTGGAGNDRIEGGAGDDRAIFSGNRADYTVTATAGGVIVSGADGVDTLIAVEWLDFVDQSIQAPIYYVGGSGPDNAPGGTTQDDIYDLGGGNDEAHGQGGDDVMRGGEGWDRLFGEAGDDLLEGGTESDALEGGDGDDRLDGGAGDDWLGGDLGADVIQGGDGNDFISGLYDNDQIAGGAGVDSLNGDDGADIIDGGDGDDLITGGMGDDVIDGGVGLDAVHFGGVRADYTITAVGDAIRITGPEGTDTVRNAERFVFADRTMVVGPWTGTGTDLEGTTGNDVLTGGATHDALFGGSGDDLLNGRAGDDYLDGGVGVDVADYSGATGGITVDLSRTDSQVIGGGMGADLLSGIEGARGSAYADRFSGSAGDNIFHGGGGGDVFDLDTVNPASVSSDQYYGEDGDDRFELSVVADVETWATIDGGAGLDTLVIDTDEAAGFWADAYGSYLGGGVGSQGLQLQGVERVVTGGGADTVLLHVYGQSGLTQEITFETGGGDDRIEGNVYRQIIRAGDGNDTVRGNGGLDLLYGGAGDDDLTAALGDFVYGEAGADLVRAGPGYGGTGTGRLDGGEGVDTLHLNSRAVVDLADSSIVGDGFQYEAFGFENVRMEVSYGEDSGGTAYGNAGANVMSAWTEFTSFTAGAVIFDGRGGDDVLSGHNGADQLSGGDGNDLLVGGAGADGLNGGAGVDTADYSAAAWRVTASLASGLTTADGDGGADTLAAIENLIGSAFADSLTGDSGANVLSGRGGNDVLVGGAGVDTADYSAASAGMRAQLNTNASTNDGDGGADTFSGIENLTGSNFNDVLIGDGAANALRGGLGADTLIGLAGNDVLWGGAGAANTLQGGVGDDRYVLEAGDSVIEFAGEGTDTVEARINTHVLANHVENLVFGGTGDFAGTGNAAANTLTGGAGADVLRGRGGVDVLVGGAGTDTADYTLAAARVTARLDQMRAASDGDGASDSFASIENLTGSNFDDLLIGNGANNVLRGGVGVDILLGFNGDDVLMGGSLGNNQLQGGLGNDWYVLDAFDTCVEFAGEGIDTVESRIGSYNMGANIENLVHTGPGGFVGTGNALNNQITGGAFNDILRGGGGNDTIRGGLGRDEVQVRGSQAQYTVTAENGGWRVVDSVAGRDGSTWIEGVEVLRFTTGNTQQLLTYPVAAAAPAKGAADADAFVLPAQPLVLPGLAMAKGFDAPLVLPDAGDALFPDAGLLPMDALLPDVFAVHHDWMG